MVGVDVSVLHVSQSPTSRDQPVLSALPVHLARNRREIDEKSTRNQCTNITSSNKLSASAGQKMTAADNYISERVYNKMEASTLRCWPSS